MTIELQRGRFLRVVDGAGSTLTAHAGSVEAFSDAAISLEH
jgi:hypothetical protein